MSFSLRSMFNKNEPKGSGAVSATFAPASLDLTLPIHPPPDSVMSPSGTPSSPSPYGAPLFRTLGDDGSSGEPLGFVPGQSPFQSHAPSGVVALTVADVLPQIPPEMARATSIPQDQPVQISPQILNQALSSGQLAVPLFEIYRVCPGIFQTPVSPDDSRMVRLPAAKLPALISGAMPSETPAAPAPTPASPFESLFSAPPTHSTPVPSPFQSLLTPESPAASPSTFVPEASPRPVGATVLPPRRDPSQAPASSLPPSPFLTTTAQAPAAVSPFAQAAPAPAPIMPSPLSGESPASPFVSLPTLNKPTSLFTEAVSSPFAATPEPATPPQNTTLPSFNEGNSSPFASATPTALPTETPLAAQASPFGLSVPVEPEPSSPATLLSHEFTAAMPATSFTQASIQGKITGAAMASVAALLQGQSADALGFDPAMVPSWISTQLNGGVVAEIQEMPEPSLDLGTIIDGITDIGFRNVLNSARRGHTVKVPLELLSSVQASAPAAAANASLPPTPSAAAPMRVTPTAPLEASAQPFPFTTSPAAAELANPFMASPQPQPATAVPEPAAPLFKIEPGNPFASVPEAPPPNTPEPTLPPQMEEPTQAFTPPPFTATTPIQPTISLQDLFGSSHTASQPAMAKESEVETPPPSLTPTPTQSPTPTPTQPPASSGFAFTSKAFDPFAPAEETPAAKGGFSSFDLLGGHPTPQEPELKEHPAAVSAAVPEPSKPEAWVDAIAQTAPTPAEPVLAHPFFESEPESQTEPSIVPEIPMTLEIPETMMPEPKASTWPDIDPIPAPTAPAPAPALTPTRPIAAPLFVEKEKTVPVSVAPVLDFSPPEKIAPSPAMPTLAPSPRGIAPAKPSLGLSAMERSGEEQLLLRALLDTDEELSLERVIEMSSQLPGIAACALVRGNEVIAGSSTKGTDAKAFRSQAAEVAKSLRTLAPLIGISDAETFTLNTDSRLITLCFPGEVTLAILHDREPTLGLRDKLTLIARQLDSMVSKG